MASGTTNTGAAAFAGTAPYKRTAAMLAEYAQTQATGDSIKLPELQLSGITVFITEKALIEELGAAVPITDVTTGTVIINKDIEAQLHTKQGIGQYGHSGVTNRGDIDNALVNPIAIPFMTGKVISQGLTAVDKMRGLSYTLVDKAPKYMDVLRKDYERTGWAQVVALDSVAPTTLPAAVTSLLPSTAANAILMKNTIIAAATAMTLTRDPTQGIDLIDRERISIYMNPTAFDALVDGGLVGNRATASFDGGQYSIGSLGGYRIVANPFLAGMTGKAKEVAAVIATNFSFFSRMKFVAYNTGKVDQLSNDMGTYIETAYARGVVFENKATAAIQKVTQTISHAGKGAAQAMAAAVPAIPNNAIKFVSVVELA